MREVGILKKDPESLKDQIQKLEAMSKFLRDDLCICFVCVAVLVHVMCVIRLCPRWV